MIRGNLGALVGAGWQGWIGSLPPGFETLLLVALVISALGFYRLVYFVSLGYGFSIAGMAGVGLVYYGGTASWMGWLHSVLLGVYGVRLSGYLLLRERQPSYQRELEDVQKRAVGVGRIKQVGIWLGVSLLYGLMFSPAFFHLASVPQSFGWRVFQGIGLGIAALGLGIEALADRQKARFKEAYPSRFCDTGLYRIVRCPNYFGEIVFWVGSWLAAVPLYQGVLRASMAGSGLLCIVLIMMGSTKRLEQKQTERYGGEQEYQAYTQSVPVLFPFVPIYSLKGVRVYLE